MLFCSRQERSECRKQAGDCAECARKNGVYTDLRSGHFIADASNRCHDTEDSARQHVENAENECADIASRQEMQAVNRRGNDGVRLRALDVGHRAMMSE